MPFHRIEPAGNPEDHDSPIPLEEPDDRPAAPPRRPPSAPPSVFVTASGAVAVSKEQARLRMEARCPECDYSIVGLTSALCPECGVELIPAIAAAQRRARDRQSVKHEYTAALVSLGVAVLALAAVVTLAYGHAAIPFYLVTLAVITPLAFVAYLICCSLWIGFDMPLGITALRLAAVYAWSDATGALFDIVFPYVSVVGWIFSIVVMFSLLTKWLDIDTLDALGLTMVTNFIAFAVTMGMIHWFG